MGILRRLREWREDKNGTLIGPDIQADSVKTDQLNNVETPDNLSDLKSAVGTADTTVIPQPGTYRPPSPIEPADGVTLILQSGVTLKPTDGSEINTINIQAASDVSVIGQGGVIDGNRQNMANDTGACIRLKGVASDARLTGLIIKDAARSGINGDGAYDNIRVTDCYITDTNHNGCKITNGDGSVVANNRFVNAGIVSSEAIDIRASQDVLAEGNVISDFQSEGIIVANGAEDVALRDNKIFNGTVGIRVEGTSTRSVIESNTIRDIQEHGIYHPSGQGTEIKDNTFIDIRQVGSGGYGAIQLDGGSNDEVLVQDNKHRQPGSEDTSFFIRASGDTDDDITGLRVLENDVRNTVFTLSAVEYSNVSDLKIRQNEGYKTEATGAPTLASGDTSTTQAHGLDETPDAEDFQVTPLDNLGSASYWWVSSVDSSNFTISVDTDPTQNVQFSWRARIEP